MMFPPVGGLTKIDPKILNEELQDKFRTPGDFMMPTVVILESNANGIVFWYGSDIASLQEVTNAATAQETSRKAENTAEWVAAAADVNDRDNPELAAAWRAVLEGIL